MGPGNAAFLWTARHLANLGFASSGRLPLSIREEAGLLCLRACILNRKMGRPLAL